LDTRLGPRLGVGQGVVKGWEDKELWRNLLYLDKIEWFYGS